MSDIRCVEPSIDESMKVFSCIPSIKKIFKRGNAAVIIFDNPMREDRCSTFDAIEEFQKVHPCFHFYTVDVEANYTGWEIAYEK